MRWKQKYLESCLILGTWQDISLWWQIALVSGEKWCGKNLNVPTDSSVFKTTGFKEVDTLFKLYNATHSVTEVGLDLKSILNSRYFLITLEHVWFVIDSGHSSCGSSPGLNPMAQANLMIWEETLIIHCFMALMIPVGLWGPLCQGSFASYAVSSYCLDNTQAGYHSLQPAVASI